MKLLSIYNQISGKLGGAEARAILEYVTESDFSSAFAQNPELSSAQIDEKNRILARRKTNEPLAYIINERWFYGRPYYINESVLIPRQETELLVEQALKIAQKNGYGSALDMFTGSGCIGISLVLEMPSLKVNASDISEKALAVAQKNAENLGANIGFLCSDMFTDIDEKFDLITANPPYVSDSEYFALDPAVRDFEPSLALKAGKNGLDYLTKLAEQAENFLNPGGALIMEIGYDQGKAVKKLFPGVQIIADYSGLDRIAVVTIDNNC